MSYELSVLIPAYNEAGTIVKILDKLNAVAELSGPRIQYVVVDDGSKDETVACLKNSRYWRDSRFVFVLQKRNGGKGTAIRAGLEKVTGEYVIVQDADLEYDPQDIVKLWHEARTKNLAVVYGSRNLASKGRHGQAIFYFGGKLVTWFTNLLYGTKLTDEPTCYKLFRTDVLREMPLVCRRFEFCPEVTAYAAKAGLPILEVPISYFPRSKAEGKKINWRDGVEALLTLVRLRFDFKNPYVLAGLVSLVVLGIYLLTWQRTFGGYEGETFQAADNLLLGRYEMKRAGLGAAVLYLPFLLWGRFVSQITDYQWFSIVPVVYSAFTSGVIFLILAELMGSRRRDCILLVTLGIALGSSMWPYINLGMEYQAMLGVSLLLWALLHWRRATERPLAVGMVLAWLIITKSYGVVFALPTLLFIYTFLKNTGRLAIWGKLTFWLQLLLPAVVFYALTLVLGQFSGSVFGSYALGHEFQIWHWWEGFYGTFFSFGQGILIYNPLLFIALCCWSRFWRTHRETAIFVLVGFLMLLLLTAPFSFWSDETWTVRKLMPVLPLLYLPLVSLRFGEGKWKTTWQKTAVALVFLLAFLVQLTGAVYDYGKRMNFLYTHNLDSLETMRYVPSLSPLYFNAQLGSSYVRELLHLPPAQFHYHEFSWRARLFGAGDESYRQVTTTLEAYHQPDVFWLRNFQNPYAQRSVGTAWFLILLPGALLAINYFNARLVRTNSKQSSL